MYDKPAANILQDYLDANPEVKGISGAFSAEFELTWARTMERFGSIVQAFLLKPKDHMQQSFGLEREILCVYSSYDEETQPRIIQLAEYMLTEFVSTKDRSETLVYILISDDNDIEEFVDKHLADHKSSRLIVPFIRRELEEHSKRNPHYIRDVFRKNLYNRDLFDMQSPLLTDAYYFGRKDITPKLVDRVKQGQNTGIFGLRKSGKTSLLYSVMRKLEQGKIAHSLYIDAEQPSFYHCRWYEALEYIIRTAYKVHFPTEIYKIEQFTEKKAGELFKQELKRFLEKMSLKKLVLIIDEFEFICFSISESKHWNEDFAPFWQALRAIHQETQASLQFIVAGVNARAVETPNIVTRDNPIYQFINTEYLAAFDRDEIRSMVRSLGRPMGIKFDEDVYEYLAKNYGGHPFLIRQTCSWQNKHIIKKQDRPITISVADLKISQKRRDSELVNTFVEQIVNLLLIWYPTEYNLLRELAKHPSEFSEFNDVWPNEIKHLYNYGLIVDDPKTNTIRFTVNAVQDYFLSAKAADDHPTRKSLNDMNEKTILDLGELQELWVRSALHRNTIEAGLRKLVRQLLQSKHAKKWIDKVIENIQGKEIEKRKEQLRRTSPEKVLDDLFLLDLTTIIENNWDVFQVLESYKLSKSRLKELISILNENRPDAHAKPATSSDIAVLNHIYEVFKDIFQEYGIETKM